MFRWLMFFLRKIDFKYLGYGLIALGVGLFCISVYGVFFPYDLRDEFDPTLLSYDQAVKALEKIEHISEPIEQVEAVNQIVHQSLHYDWPEDKTFVPPHDNWVLSALGVFEKLFNHYFAINIGNIFSNYQFLDPYEGLQRGFGICSQQALILCGLIQDYLKYPADIVALDGHVISRVRLPNTEVILADPAYGVVIPMRLREAERSIEQVGQYYQPIDSEHVATFFDSQGNLVIENAPKNYRPKIYYIEKISFLIKWLLPLLMILVGWRFVIQNNQNHLILSNTPCKRDP